MAIQGLYIFIPLRQLFNPLISWPFLHTKTSKQTHKHTNQTHSLCATLFGIFTGSTFSDFFWGVEDKRKTRLQPVQCVFNIHTNKIAQRDLSVCCVIFYFFSCESDDNNTHLTKRIFSKFWRKEKREAYNIRKVICHI